MESNNVRYCPRCGKENHRDAVTCVHCGCQIASPYRSSQNNQAEHAHAQASGDAANAGVAVIGFFIPIIGVLLYLFWMDSMPKRARSAGKGALFGAIVGITSVIAYTVLSALLLGGTFSLIGLQ